MYFKNDNTIGYKATPDYNPDAVGGGSQSATEARFTMYQFDNRDTSKAVTKTADNSGYNYTMANGQIGYIDNRQFQRYQQQAQSTAYNNYTKVAGADGLTGLQKDQAYLSKFAMGNDGNGTSKMQMAL